MCRRNVPSTHLPGHRSTHRIGPDTGCMAVSREERRGERSDRVEALFGKKDGQPALDLIELVELAWHDCYGEVTPPEPVVSDILTVSGGSLGRLISASHLAIVDRRDLQLAAEAHRHDQDEHR